jgi:hypothetical protein
LNFDWKKMGDNAPEGTSSKGPDVKVPISEEVNKIYGI